METGIQDKVTPVESVCGLKYWLFKGGSWARISRADLEWLDGEILEDFLTRMGFCSSSAINDAPLLGNSRFFDCMNGIQMFYPDSENCKFFAVILYEPFGSSIEGFSQLIFVEDFPSLVALLNQLLPITSLQRSVTHLTTGKAEVENEMSDARKYLAKILGQKAEQKKTATKLN